MNTHRGVIETSVPPGIEFICAGDKEFVREHLRRWLTKHPLGEYQTALILRVEPYEEERCIPLQDPPTTMDLYRPYKS